MIKIVVTTWNNGSPNYSTGSGFGLKISDVNDRDTYISRAIGKVKVLLENGSVILVNINKKSFWGVCRELIKKEIGRWLIENNLGTWEPGKPHKLALEYIGVNTFILRVPK